MSSQVITRLKVRVDVPGHVKLLATAIYVLLAARLALDPPQAVASVVLTGISIHRRITHVSQSYAMKPNMLIWIHFLSQLVLLVIINVMAVKVHSTINAFLVELMSF